MKKERGMSGALSNVASLLSSSLPLLCPSSPRQPPARGGERRPSGSRKSLSRVSSRQFREPQLRAPRDASGNSRCHSKDGKELVQWPEAPQRQGAKAWSHATGLGRLPETRGPGDLCPAQNCTTVICLASWGRERERICYTGDTSSDHRNLEKGYGVERSKFPAISHHLLSRSWRGCQQLRQIARTRNLPQPRDLE